MAKAVIFQNPARGEEPVFAHHDAPGQHAERALDDAHMAVKHHIGDACAVEQRTDKRQQNHIVAANQLLHRHTFRVPASILPLPPALRAAYGPRPAKMERPLGVVVPLEEPRREGAGIQALSELVAADLERVNALILSRTGSEVQMIPEVANHLISSGGKRLRPLLTLASAKLAGYAGEGHVRLAAAVEFMHTATLLHDDVVDESEMRRGKLAPRMMWGNQASVLVGDFLLGQAFKMMVEVGSIPCLDILSTAATVIAEGEVMQLAAAKNIATTEDEYLAVIRAKTAALFAAACEVGPALVQRPKAEQAACRSYGANLGIAFQLVDDALDYGGREAKLGKKVGDDLREGKITLPVIFAVRRGTPGEREFWKKTLEAGEIDDSSLEIAIDLLVRHGAIDETLARARHYGAIARDALALFPDSAPKAAMLDVVDFVTSRAH
jgi:octaprenyl-diphosphate synthase